MNKQFVDHKTVLCTFTHDELINEINQKINELISTKLHSNMTDNRYE